MYIWLENAKISTHSKAIRLNLILTINNNLIRYMKMFIKYHYIVLIQILYMYIQIFKGYKLSE